MSRFSVTILGCGSAFPTTRHQPSCQVVDFRGNLFMIDCGENAQTGMRRARLKYSRLGHIFITHLHGDHCFGLPGLLSTMALQGKGGVVTVYMPREGIDVFRPFIDYFCREMPFEVKFVPVDNKERQTVFENDSLVVESFPLYHRVPCVGYIFREKEKQRHLLGDMVRFYDIPVSRLSAIKAGEDYVTPDGTVIPNVRLTVDADPSASYAYCSDTVYDPRVAEAVKGVDVLYHEATYGDEFKIQARKRGHSTAREAAEIAAKAGVGRLVLGHFSKRYIDESPLLAEAREVFNNVSLANEGMRIEL